MKGKRRKVEVSFESGGIGELYGRMAYEMAAAFLRDGVSERTISSRLSRAGHPKEAIRYGIKKAKAQQNARNVLQPLPVKQLQKLFESSGVVPAAMAS